jgi:hypothetical protein
MKYRYKKTTFYKLIFLFMISTFIYKSAESQNALINILTQNTGIVKKGKTLFLEVYVNNTDPANHIGIYKIRVQVSVPSAFVTIAQTGHVLPTGWKIMKNDGSVMMLSNGKDMIAPTDGRVILIALKGEKVGGPNIITGQLSVADGIEPGMTPGVLQGDLTADNYSTTSCQVVK